jgi:hypothetical protein
MSSAAIACEQAPAAITAQSAATATRRIILVGIVFFPIPCQPPEFDGGLLQTSRHPAARPDID